MLTAEGVGGLTAIAGLVARVLEAGNVVKRDEGETSASPSEAAFLGEATPAFFVVGAALPNEPASRVRVRPEGGFVTGFRLVRCAFDFFLGAELGVAPFFNRFLSDFMLAVLFGRWGLRSGGYTTTFGGQTLWSSKSLAQRKTVVGEEGVADG